MLAKTTKDLDYWNNERRIPVEFPPESLSQDPRLSVIAQSLHDGKANDVVLLDLRPVSDVADYFILCSASSDPHMKSLVTDLVDKLRLEGHKPWHIEGMEQRRWVLVDLVDIVVHIFKPDVREFYALDRLWGDAELTQLDEELPNSVPTQWRPEDMS